MRYFGLLFCILLFQSCDSTGVSDTSPFQISDLEFEMVEHNWEAPPNVTTGEIYGSISISYPLPQNGPQFFQDSVYHHIRRRITRGYSYEEFAQRYLPNEFFLPSFHRQHFSASSRIISKGDWLSVRVGIFNEQNCGASCNGAYTIHILNIKRDGSLLPISDIFSDNDAFYEIAESYFRKRAGYYGFFKNRFFIPKDWYVVLNDNYQGVVLQYQAYAVGPGAAGTIAFFIPLSLFKEHIKDQYWVKAIKYSDDSSFITPDFPGE